MTDIPDPRTGEPANDVMLASRDPCIFVGLEACVIELARARRYFATLSRNGYAPPHLTVAGAYPSIEPLVNASDALTALEINHLVALYARAYNGEK